jgi:UDP-N-acetylmuramoyl-L-alanyl-D-glutamate--2,6-diaminopimelate ligase
VSAPRRLSELLAGIADVPAASDVAVGGLGLDSRRIAPGDAFVALAGSREHGLAFAPQALAAGAAAILFEPPGAAPGANVPVIAVPGLRRALGSIATRLYGAPSEALTVIGVTGTNGKTSTVQLLAQALSAAGHRVGTIGTLGAGLYPELAEGERTTPDVISTHGLIAAMRDRGATHLAMEVSSHALAQGRVDAVAYDLAVFTNLTRDHLDYHGDMSEYGAAKRKLFLDWPLQGAVINRDDAFGRELLALPPRAERVLSYSVAGEPGAELSTQGLRSSAAGLEFELATPWGRGAVRSRVLGRFNVSNLLAVAGCLGLLGWGFERIAQALAQLSPVPGRMNRLGGDAQLPLVVVDYAHTPDALEQALHSLRAHGAGRIVCVFGCGGERDRGKRPEMARIAERLSDRVIVTDDNPRGEDGDAIVAEIRAGFAHPERARVIRDRARAIAEAVAEAGPGDMVLIAGKGHEPYQEIGGAKRPFDDLAEARRALEALSPSPTLPQPRGGRRA